jgi:hypothetical protein
MNADIKPKLIQERLTHFGKDASNCTINANGRQHTSAPRTADSETQYHKYNFWVAQFKIRSIKNARHLKEVSTLEQDNY